MEKELKEGKWLSNGFQLLTRHHRNEEGIDASRLSSCDKLAFYAELLSERAPDEWASAVKLAEGIIAAQTAATSEAAPPIPKKANGKKK
jgi:hypothetical protein